MILSVISLITNDLREKEKYYFAITFRLHFYVRKKNCVSLLRNSNPFQSRSLHGGHFALTDQPVESLGLAPLAPGALVQLHGAVQVEDREALLALAYLLGLEGVDGPRIPARLADETPG